MKSRFAFLALAASLLSASAFAGEQAKGVVTIQVAGKTVATVSLADQPAGSQMSLEADSKDTSTIYDARTGIATMKGNFTFEVKQNERSLWHIAVEDGTATFQFSTPATAPAATPLPLPDEHPGNFCGQSEVARMVMNTPAWQEIQRQQAEEALRESKDRIEATRQAPAQPTPATPQK